MGSENKQMIEWRRSQVFKLWSEGYSEREIGKQLQVSDTTIHNDIVFLVRKAKDNISLYVDDKLPSEYERCLVGINSILKEAWDMSKGIEDKKERIQALSLAKECYSMITDLLTNVGVIREAMRFVTDKKKSSTKEESLNINKNREPETINKVF
jgi:IS30 family transposase